MMPLQVLAAKTGAGAGMARTCGRFRSAHYPEFTIQE